MPQTSGPLPNESFPQSLWQQHFLAQNGIVGDTDGTAFSITLPPAGDDASLGSASVDSIAKVRGFPLTIAAGSSETITIPPSASGGTTGRTDLVVARCDIPTFTTAPGPVRLHRIAGTEGSLTVPAHDPAKDLRLWAVRRRQGEALNQAITTDLRSWTAAPIVIQDSAPLPTLAPLGLRARRGVQEFVRQLIAGVPTWVDLQANLGQYQSYTPTFNTSNITLHYARWVREGNKIRVEIGMVLHSMGSQQFSCSLPVPGRTHQRSFTKPMGRAVARRGPSTGSNISAWGDVVNIQGDGSITAVTVVGPETGPNARWGPNNPISWNDEPGTDIGISIEYEAAS